MLLALSITTPAGRVLAFVDSVPRSYTEAMDWYRAGAEAGDPKAAFYLGLAFEEGAQGTRDLGAARAWFKRAAEAGHALARYKQAAMLQTRRGGPEDLAEARRLYALAASQGVVEAQYNFAVMLQDGSGGPVDLAKAGKLFESAARGGIDISFLHLAVLNTRGAGADLVEALKWTILADAANVDGTLDYIKALKPLLSATKEEQAKTRARDWK